MRQTPGTVDKPCLPHKGCHRRGPSAIRQPCAVGESEESAFASQRQSDALVGRSRPLLGETSNKTPTNHPSSPGPCRVASASRGKPRAQAPESKHRHLRVLEGDILSLSVEVWRAPLVSVGVRLSRKSVDAVVDRKREPRQTKACLWQRAADWRLRIIEHQQACGVVLASWRDRRPRPIPMQQPCSPPTPTILFNLWELVFLVLIFDLCRSGLCNLGPTECSSFPTNPSLASTRYYYTGAPCSYQGSYQA